MKAPRGLTATVSCEITLTIEQLAEFFTQLTDDDQAQFFCKVAEVADRTYTDGLMKHPQSNADWQWSAVGKHLRECECSTDRGREMVAQIYDSMRTP